MLDFNKAGSSVVLVFLGCGVRVLYLSAVGADMTSSCSLGPRAGAQIVIVRSSNALTNDIHYKLELGSKVFFFSRWFDDEKKYTAASGCVPQSPEVSHNQPSR